MPRLILFLVGTLLFGMQLHAQDSAALQQRKLQMMLAAVNFYVEDVKAFGQGHTPCKSQTVSDLKACASSLEKVKDKIAAWDVIPLKTAADLTQLRQAIIDTVTRKKPYREKLPGYKAFVEQLRKFSELPTDSGGVREEAPPPISTGPSPDSSATTDPNAGGVHTSTPVGGPAPSLLDELTVWNIVAMALGAAALVVAAAAFKRSGNRIQHGRASTGASSTSFRLELEAKMARLEYDYRQLEDQVSRVEGDLSRKLKERDARDAEDDALFRTQAIAFREAAAAPVFGRKWAKYPDGNAFDPDTLADQPDRQSVYEILQDGPATASFRVSDRDDAQKFALSNPSVYLREACHYDTTPAANSRIITEKPGRLELEGRRWKIKTPAHIAFA